MSDIFISYATADRARVAPLVRAFEQRGWSVWWDQHVRAGKAWDQAIEEALKNAQCVIVVWSRNSVSSDWVVTEAEEAKRRRILVPVLLDDVEIPFAFRRIQTARLIGWPDALPCPQFDDVVVGVAEVLARATGAQPVTPPPSLQRQPWIRKKTIARAFLSIPIVAGILAVPGLGGYYLSHNHPSDHSDVSILPVASTIGLTHLEYGGYTQPENMRLSRRIRQAKSIKLLAPNADNFVQTFKRDLQDFLAKPESTMQVLLAKPGSNFYREETRMTTESAWNEKGAAYLENNNIINTTRLRLQELAVDKSKIEFKYFDTQFRLPMILIDDKYCFLTIRLSPDESPQSPRMEFEGGTNPYSTSCVHHFNKLWSLSSPNQNP